MQVAKLSPIQMSTVNFASNTNPELIPPKEVDISQIRRVIMERRDQIGLLEREVSKASDLLPMVREFISEYQGKIEFFDKSTQLESITPSPFAAMDIIESGINRYIDAHERLSERFDLEFTKASHSLEQQYETAQSQLRRELSLLEEERSQNEHNASIVELLRGENRALQQIICMRSESASSHEDLSEKQREKLTAQLEQSSSELMNAKNSLTIHQSNGDKLDEKVAKRKADEDQQMNDYMIMKEDLLKEREKLQNTSFLHNQTISELDNAKEELSQLCRTIESYHDNLKTQELLGAEIENKRLHSILKIEKNDADKRLKKELKKTKALEEEASKIAEHISELNSQIGATEQKIQTQMMRIPDINQLHQALDRVLLQSKHYQEQVMEKKYFLDEIRDRNRALEQMEIAESKERMAQLRLLMPLHQEVEKKKNSANPQGGNE